MLPTILASSVIRSTHRGDSHGGIYRIDLKTQKVTQMLDWNNPNINWEGRGGDRGVRGMAFWGNILYAVAGNELFAFCLKGDQLELVASYTHPNLLLTHEAWRHRDKLYICAGGTDSILVFDLVGKEWTHSYYHSKDSMGIKCFHPLYGIHKSDGGYMHLDSVYANDDYMWYSGAYTDGLWQYNLNTGQTIKIQLQIPDTHNARPYKGGYLYNLSRLSQTVFEEGGVVQHVWNTPKYRTDKLTNTHLPQDHAVQGYTRGMVTYNGNIITGSSPATVNVFSDQCDGKPFRSVKLTNDLRNSICGMVLYEW